MRGASPHGSTFFADVYALVRTIPRGRVLTYGEVARLLGRSRGARAVGWALRALRSAVEPSVPWHRVVGQGGRISPRPGPGMFLQRRRLSAEGVRFREGRVDLARHGLAQAQGALTAGRRRSSRARRRR